jgi:hypothetical protein
MELRSIPVSDAVGLLIPGTRSNGELGRVIPDKRRKGMEVIVVLSISPDGKGEKLEIVTPKGRLFDVLADKIRIQDERQKEGILVPKLIIE